MCECGKKTCIDCDGTPESKQKVPHRHAALIKAWADGSAIEHRSNHSTSWTKLITPRWDSKGEYRIKPEPTPDVVLFACLEQTLPMTVLGNLKLCYNFNRTRCLTDSVMVVYDGETGKLKSISMLD